MIDLRTRLDALSDDDRLVLDAARDYAGRDPELKRVRALRDVPVSKGPITAGCARAERGRHWS